MKIIIFDIDKTICKTTKLNYNLSKPIKHKILLINKLYEKGHIIKLFTARYMGRYKGNVRLIEKKFYRKTKKQLKTWGLKFHELIMGKPIYDIFIDDKAYNVNDKKLKKIFLQYLK
jgi:FMN phosphatase YigB (HAD superfamily)